ncbi:uncharacterized protein LOC107460331 [Arachis duranensis]|uniref:Uncharacterized protein LOC107460331 n=1 Tax=Arachis duranensis TaxID=130453 RepID=A0A6P4B0I9_ARADU|nr:uncharacterized protein LOC107460331 [Arachis duranensis]
MRKEVEPKEEHFAEDLKEKKAQEKIGSALVHTPIVMEEPEVLEKKPPYMAYRKSVFSEKKTLREDEIVVLTKECNALVQKKLPQKLPDPGSFLLPCTIGSITFEKALCDLGSSINLMSLFMMKKLGIQEAHPTRISLEMADKSLKQAYGLVENVLVKVEDLYLPADFVILNTGEEKDDSIILGRPFLATERAMIEVERTELCLRMHEEYLLFKILKHQPLSDKDGTSMQSSALKPPHSAESHTESPDIKPKFGVGDSPPTSE